MSRPPGSAPPPSERDAERQPRPGVGLFRLAAWSWGVTGALVIGIALLLVVGAIRNDPERNPPPPGYESAVCQAFGGLSAGTNALARAVDHRGDVNVKSLAIGEARRRLEAAHAALADLPAWPPGERLEELLAGLIISLANGTDARDAEAVENAVELVDAGRAQLAEGRYGFDCGV